VAVGHAARGAVTTVLPEGRIAVTVDLDVNSLAPADGDSAELDRMLGSEHTRGALDRLKELLVKVIATA
jgi:hypothetical protein